MKFEKTHFLLMAFSILLLISIGSVCAVDDSAADADTQISDTGYEAILNDNISSDPANEEATKIKTEVVSSNVSIKDKESVKIPINVKDNSSNNITIGKDDINVINGNKSLKFTYNNSEITITDKLSVGKYNLILNYLGNANYTNSSTNIVLDIFRDTIEVPSSVNVNSTKIVNIPITITDRYNPVNFTKDDLTLTLTYKQGNNTVSKVITDFQLNSGVIKFELENNNYTSGTLKITYNGTSKEVTIKNIINARIDVVSNMTIEYKNGFVVIRFIDIDTNEPIVNKEMQLTVTGNIGAGFTTRTNASGEARWNVANLYEFELVNGTLDAKSLKIKSYPITIENKDSNIVSTRVSTNLTIKKAEIIIQSTNFQDEYGTSKRFEVTVVFKSNGNPVPNEVIRFDVPKSTQKTIYAATNENGTTSLVVSSLTGGTYKISSRVNDTERLNGSKVDNTITIIKKTVVISHKNVKIYYNSGTTTTIKVTDKKTGKAVAGAIVKVKIYTGSKSKIYYFQTNSKGQIPLMAPLSVGKHKIAVGMDKEEPRYKASAVTKYITVVKNSGRFSAPATTAYYKQGKNFVIKLISKKTNKVMYNAKVNIRVYLNNGRYYNYVGDTGADGTVKLKITLNPGTYKVGINGKDTKSYSANYLQSSIKVIKAPTKLTPTGVTAKQKTNKYFTVKAINTKTKKIIPNMKVGIKVYTGKSFKTYYANTDSKGIAKLNVKIISVGTHKVSVYSANSHCKATAVSSTIKITR